MPDLCPALLELVDKVALPGACWAHDEDDSLALSFHDDSVAMISDSRCVMAVEACNRLLKSKTL